MGKVAPESIAQKYGYSFKPGDTEQQQSTNRKSKAAMEPSNSNAKMASPQRTKPLTQQKSHQKPAPKQADSSLSQTKPGASELREKRAEAQKVKIEKIKSIQNREMLQVLEEEQKLEASRDLRLRETTADEERERLERDFGKERSKAQKRIKNMMKNHKEVLMAAER